MRKGVRCRDLKLAPRGKRWVDFSLRPPPVSDQPLVYPLCLHVVQKRSKTVRCLTENISRIHKSSFDSVPARKGRRWVDASWRNKRLRLQIQPVASRTGKFRDTRSHVSAISIGTADSGGHLGIRFSII